MLPLLAIPIYLVGTGIADALDDDPTNGVFALGLFLGVGLPVMTSLVFARSWSELSWLPTIALGVGSGLASLGVLLVTFVAYCSATTCVV